MRIDPTKITNWRTASKTRPIQAKPLNCILIDKTIKDKFLLDTLEGREPLGTGVMICLGEAGDIWQQTLDKVLKKYRVIRIDCEGWMTCDPLPDNAVDCIEVSASMCVVDGHNRNVFSIIGHYGETVGEETNVQYGEAGDFICRNQTDHTDVWIVRRKLFENTYVITS